MSAIKVREYRPEKPGYGQRLTRQEWERLRPVLTQLSQQGLSRHDIVRVATEQHGFQGTYAALNQRFKDWGLTNPRSKDGEGTTKGRVYQEGKNRLVHKEHSLSGEASETTEGETPSAGLVTPKDSWRPACAVSPAQRSGDERHELTKDALNARQAQQTTDTSPLVCIADNEEPEGAEARFPLAYGSEADSTESLVAPSVDTTTSHAGSTRLAADEIDQKRATEYQVLSRLSPRGPNIELEEHLQRQQELFPRSRTRSRTQYRHRAGLGAFAEEQRSGASSPRERPHHRNDTRPTSTSALHGGSLETHASKEDINHARVHRHKSHRRPQSTSSTPNNGTSSKGFIPVLLSSLSEQSHGKSKLTVKERAELVEQPVPAQDRTITDPDEFTDLSNQRCFSNTSSESHSPVQGVPAPIHTEPKVRQQGHGRSESRETITVRQDEYTERILEHWRRPPDEPRRTPIVIEHPQKPVTNKHARRTRSEVSTPRSSKVSLTSSTRSFAHLAKRLRQQLPGQSFVSLMSSLSAASSHSSQAFAAVTGFGPDLSEEWCDESMGKTDSSVVDRSSTTTKRKALEEYLGREVPLHIVAKWRKLDGHDQFNIFFALCGGLETRAFNSTANPPNMVSNAREPEWVRLLTKKGVDRKRRKMLESRQNCIYIDLGYGQARTFVRLTKSDVERHFSLDITVPPVCDILRVPSIQFDPLPLPKILRKALERKARRKLEEDDDDGD
ncbi:hypothetical protein LTR70_003783 [Exophiala xenobiotica]|uniref:Clr5 domain-containing protein n=1 Tax=Lithohypha guttulata TaxID=1690604 RepID=A0ABR0KG82_9EURO|nr:hypothetical protein LTR24_003350 [Lithohypha guttulata]KAK5322282.1 hypothetical protein LTR70_003783 [Exophiala xenobiotica]